MLRPPLYQIWKYDTLNSFVAISREALSGVPISEDSRAAINIRETGETSGANIFWTGHKSKTTGRENIQVVLELLERGGR